MFAKLNIPPGVTVESVSKTEIILRIPETQLGETPFLHVVTLNGVSDGYAPSHTTQEVYAADPTLVLDGGLLEAHYRSGRVQWGRDAVFHGRTRFSLPTYDFLPWTEEDRSKNELPLDPGTDVAVQYANGAIDTGPARLFQWGNHSEPYDCVNIVGYVYIPKSY